MKKALIAIISAIYVIAIIIVSFLGIRSDVSNRTIYAEEVILLNKNIYYPGAPETDENIIIQVYERPEESHIKEDGKDDIEDMGITWNYGEEKKQKRDYAIFVYDYNFLLNEMGGNYKLEAKVKPDDTTKKDLEFYISGGDGSISTLSYNKTTGEVFFKEKYTNWINVDAFIQTTDGSAVDIDVLMAIHPYSNN